MTVTLDGLSFDLTDFVGSDGLGHTETQSATTGASGESYPAEALFPNRVFRAALNQLGLNTYASSSTSLTIGTGSKVFTLDSGVQIQEGAFVLITDTSDPANFMYGQITDVTGLAYTVNITSTGGSGTIASWLFQISGIQGATGAPIADGDKGDVTVSSSGTVWQVISEGIQAKDSSGMDIRNSSGTDVANFGAGGGTGATFNGGVNINSGTTSARSGTVAVSGTSKTLSLSDQNTIQECSNAGAQTIVIPPNANVAFPIGTWITFEQHGAGQVTITGDDGASPTDTTVQVNGTGAGSVSISAQWGAVTLRKIGTNSWIAYGSI